ncbi:MAG: hypothetical protein IJO71_08895 [Microbacterium sp.]|nr:hypothetical protein [Microbacterium sp.]MBQ9917301.1 hypothetical protein [Microbacterium sp.]
MSVASPGRKYSDGTPVPFPSYRCICGRSWEPRVPVAAKGPEGRAS